MTGEEYATRAGSAVLWLSAAIYDLVADPAEQPTRATLRRDLRAVDPEVVDAAVEALAENGFTEERDGVLCLVQDGGWRLEIAARSARPRLVKALARHWDAPPGWYVAGAGEELLALPAQLYHSVIDASIGWGPSDRQELVALHRDQDNEKLLADMKALLDLDESALRHFRAQLDAIQASSVEVPAAVIETAIDALLAYGAVTQSPLLDMASPPDDDAPPAPRPAHTVRKWLRRKLRRLG